MFRFPDLTGGVVDGRGLPLHSAVTVQGRLGGQSYLEVAIRAGKLKVCQVFSLNNNYLL